MKTTLYKTAGSLLSIVVSASVSAQILTNGGFESPALPGSTSYVYAAPAGWSTVSQAGYAQVASSNAFTALTPEPPGGKQVAFIQNNGRISRPFWIPSAGPVIVSFSATQRQNYNVSPQRLELWVDGVRRSFVLGATGAPQTSVTPPNGYYETYAVRLNLSAGQHTVSMVGLGTVDSTAFVDNVGVSTPSSWDFGLWDQNLGNGAWRSDYASVAQSSLGLPDGFGGAFTTGGCLYSQADINNGKVLAIAPAGATIIIASPPTNIPCIGGPGQPQYQYNTSQNYWSEYLYTPSNNHWRVGVNYEFLANQTADWGPPNMSSQIVTAGGVPGTRIVVTDSGPDTQFLAASPAKIAHLIWNPGSSATGKIPFSSFSANSVRGNGRPVAIADAAQSFRPFLEFRSMVADSNWRSFAVWFSIWTSGWSDGIPRGILIAALEQDASGLIGTFVPSGPTSKKVGWNWNVKNSLYYPGAMLAYFKASDLAVCGANVNVPTLPSGLTLFNASSSAMRSYRMDIRALIACVTDPAKFANPAWGGPTLPDPLVVRHVEWAIEPDDQLPATQGYLWLMTAGMRITN